jgi:serine/threonine protein kinase
MEDCPTEEELIAFARGKLSEAARDELHVHLDGCETCQQVLAEATHAITGAVRATLADGIEWNTTFQRGALVAGRYMISRFIARGAMGEVYEAFDRELSGERVALKTVTATASDSARAVRRLRAEVQLARRIVHANVCRIYDFGMHVVPETGALVHFLTMKYVEGETLGQRVRLGGALPLDEALRIARELLEALQAAHAAGILHRDFKSDNVMLELSSSDHTRAIVLDFGLARAVDHPTPTTASRPHIVGTLGYMAPEVLEYMPHSTATDVYAFGAVWFEMLTGQPPFESTTSSPERALEILRQPVPRPSSINPEVPGELDELVLRCLAHSPHDRFRTAAEVLAALDSARIGPSFGPVTSPSQPPESRRTKAHRYAFYGAVSIAGLTALAATYWLFNVQAPGPSARMTDQHPISPLGLPATAETATPAPPQVSEPPPAVAVAARPAQSSSAQVRGSVRTRLPRRESTRAALPSITSFPVPVATTTATGSNPPPDATTAPPSRGAAPTPAPLKFAPLTAPEEASPQPKQPKQRPKWENPFGRADRPTLWAGGLRSPT